ncbi:MAG: SpoIIE family protein phosphatase [bacterium]
MSIRWKMIWVIVPLVAMAILFVGLSSFWSARSGVTRSARKLLENKVLEVSNFVKQQYDVLAQVGLDKDQVYIDSAKEKIEKFAEGIKVSETSTTSYVSIYKLGSGLVEIHPEVKGASVAGEPFFREIASDKDLKARVGWIIYNWRGARRVGAYIYFQPWDWIILMSDREDEFYSEAYNILYQMGIIVGVAALFVIAAILFLVGRLTRPIQVVTETMKQIVSDDDLSRRVRMVAYDDEVGDLAHWFNEMTAELERSRIQLEQKAKMEKEMQMGRDIQKSMLPDKIPQVEGISIHAISESARQVGGDIYDFLKIDDERMAIVLGDVAGKGVSGAMYAGVALSLLRAQPLDKISPKEALINVNELMIRHSKQRTFVTLFLGVLNTKTGVIHCLSAGQDPMIIYNEERGTYERLELKGRPLGALGGKLFSGRLEEADYQMRRGDILIIHSDGVTEAMNESQEEFQQERLREAIINSDKENSEAIINSIWRSIKAFTKGAEQSDDITIIAIKCDVDFEALHREEAEPEMAATGATPNDGGGDGTESLALYRKGLEYYRQNRIREAIGALESSIGSDRPSYLPFLLLGKIYVKEKMPDKAAEMFKRSLQLNPNQPKIEEILKNLSRRLETAN